MKKSLAIFVSLLSIHLGSLADVWKIRADMWCPYSCAPGNAPGYMMEIIHLAAKSSGHTLDYQLTPWPRALNGTLRGTYTGVVGVSQAESAGLMLTHKMGEDTTCVFVRQGDPFKFKTVEDLAKLERIGTTLGVIYSPEVSQWQAANPKKFKEAAGEDTLAVNAHLLNNKSVQAFIENLAVTEYAKKSNPNLRYAASAGCIATEDL